MRAWRILLVVGSMIFLAACSPEVGSEAWCDMMRAKAKGDWTANEAVDFARHCVVQTDGA
jgi:hypothetical protein